MTDTACAIIALLEKLPNPDLDRIGQEAARVLEQRGGEKELAMTGNDRVLAALLGALLYHTVEPMLDGDEAVVQALRMIRTGLTETEAAEILAGLTGTMGESPDIKGWLARVDFARAFQSAAGIRNGVQ